MVLMAIARVLSPEQDSLGSVVVAEWSSRQRHFSPPFLLGGGFCFDRFRFDSSNSLRRIRRLAFL